MLANDTWIFNHQSICFVMKTHLLTRRTVKLEQILIEQVYFLKKCYTL